MERTPVDRETLTEELLDRKLSDLKKLARRLGLEPRSMTKQALVASILNGRDAASVQRLARNGWWSRNRGHVVAYSGLIGTLITLLAFVAPAPGQKQVTESHQRMERDLAENDPGYGALPSDEELRIEVSQALRERNHEAWAAVQQGYDLFSRYQFEEAASQFARALETVRIMPFYYSLGLAHLEAYDLEQAERAFEQGLELSLQRDDWKREARFRRIIGRTQRLDGRPALARDNLEKAMDLLARVNAPVDEEYVLTLDELAQAVAELGDLGTALEVAERAMVAGEEVFGEADPRTATLTSHLARVQRERRQLPEALALYERALEIDLSGSKQEHHNVGVRHLGISGVLLMQGDLQLAMEHAERALDIFMRLHGEMHPDVALSHAEICKILLAQGETGVEEAVEHGRKAVALLEQIYPDGNPLLSSGAAVLAMALRRQDQPSEALELARRALDSDRKVYGEIHRTVATRYGNLAVIQAQLGDLDDAEENTRIALDIDLQVEAEGSHPIAVRKGSLASILYLKGNYDAALVPAEEALAIILALQGEDHAETHFYLYRVAKIFEAQGEIASALAYAERSLRIAEAVYPEGDSRRVKVEDAVSSLRAKLPVEAARGLPDLQQLGGASRWLQLS